MKILVVTQYFWPENFRINDLALGLSERGHHVEVLTGKPNYPNGHFYPGYSFFSTPIEGWKGIQIHRSKLIPRGKSGSLRLMLNYVSFAFFSTIKVLTIGRDFDKILVYEPSPITVGLPAIVYKYFNKVPIYFWVQDLWPQSVTAAGGTSNKFVINVLEKVTRWIYKKSDKILIQSEAFREILIQQSVENKKIIYYPNSVENFFKTEPVDATIDNTLPKGFRVMFAGNIGEAQDFETIIQAAKILCETSPSVKWIILGDGRKKSYIEQEIKRLGLENQVFLMGSFPVTDMPKFFTCADCLLVSLKSEYIFSLTIPSKIQSYLACGKPIIGSLDGEGARVILEAKSGLVSNAENPEMLASKIKELSTLPVDDLTLMGNNGRNYFRNNFERELLIDRLEYIFSNE